MSEVLTIVLAGIAVGCLLWGLVDTRRAFEFPFFAGLIVCGFILPQLPGLLNAPFLPDGAYDKTILMTILCLVCAVLGWRSTSAPLAVLEADFAEKRLMEVATAFSLIGAYFYYTLSQLPASMIVGVQISGAPVIYLFFARLLTYGLVIACLSYARRPSSWMLAVIIFDCLFYLNRIVVTGKRAETAELAMIFALSFWFYRKWTVPRTLLAVGLVFTMIGMSSMSDYRKITRANSQVVLGEVAEINFFGNFAEIIKQGGPEMRNAMILIDNIDATSRFDYGAVHWNTLIWNYVPSQIFSADIKAALMLDTPSPPRDFNPLTGTTMTGMYDAFRSFWYLGALEFFLLAYVLRRIWASAMRGDTLGQFVYILSVVPGMHAFSHATDWIVPDWVQMLAFCTPAFAYALVDRRARRSRASPARETGEGA